MEGRKITKTKKKMKKIHTHKKREKIIKENTKQDSFRWVTFVYGLKIICSLTKNEQNRISILSWFCVTKKKTHMTRFDEIFSPFCFVPLTMNAFEFQCVINRSHVIKLHWQR